MDIVKKPIQTTEKMPTVPAAQLHKLAQKIEDPLTPLSLEFILTAFFPTVWKNIEKYANDCYTNGYLQGLKEGRDEAKRNS